MEISLCNDKNRLLSRDAFTVYSSCMYQPTYDKYKAKIEDFLNDRFVKMFICEVDQRIAGMLVLDCSDSVPEIVGIAVHEEFRWHGIGKSMIQNVIESEQLESATAQTDDDAIEFYRKCAFSDERIATEYSDGTAIRYNCTFTKPDAP